MEQINVSEPPSVPLELAPGRRKEVIDLVEHQNVGADLLDDRSRGAKLRITANPRRVDVDNLVSGR